MSSMIEQVKEAEAKANKILQDAQVSARDLLTAAEASAKEKKLKAAEEQRAELREALKKAEADGEKLKESIVLSRNGEADANCKEAEKKITDAIEYLLGKVVGGV